jgi:hypothetical protein
MSSAAGIVVRMAKRAVYTDADPPRACRNGHRYGPGRILLGTVLCDCAGPPRGEHRHWTCRVCGDLIIGDGHTDDRLLLTRLPTFFDELRIPPEDS